MKWKIGLVMALVCTFLFTNAQSVPASIRGDVVDSITGTTLVDATVSLLRVPNHELLRRLRSGRNGFLFRLAAPGNYQLITSYLGYLTDTLSLEIRTEDTLDRIIHIHLRPSSQDLIQVVVRSSIPPVIVRNDTIAFNAGAYPTRFNATVEDLLRKMPGIEIVKNGNVTMQGQKVDKIYLDGKEFFLNDLKTGTQNLPADLVAQVEAFDTQTEQGRLTGIKDNTGTKTLNIRLKKNKKQGYFGTVYTGAGNDHAYSAGGTASSLATPRLIFGNFNTNNINDQFNGTDNKTGPGLGGLQSLTNGNFNYRDEWGGKFKATLNGGLSEAHTTLLQSTSGSTFLTDSSLQENRFTNSTTAGKNYWLNSVMEVNLDSSNTLIYRGGYNSEQSSSESRDTAAINTVKSADNYPSNQEQTKNSNSTDGHTVHNSLDFSRKFPKKSRTLYLGLTESLQRQNQPTSLYSLVNAFDIPGSSSRHSLVNQRSAQVTIANNLGAALAYTEPLGPRHVLDFSFRMNSTTNCSDKSSHDYDSAKGKFDTPDTLTSNHFLTRNTMQQVSVGYNSTEGKFRYQLGLTEQFSNLVNRNYTQGNRLVQNFVNWFPRASLIYAIGKGKNLNLYYSGYSTVPTIDQLQPIPDLTNPFLLKLGNPGLQQQFDHNVSMNYTDINEHNARNFQAYLQGDYTEHKIASSTTLLAGGIQQVMYINMEGVYNFSTSLVFGFPLGDRQKGTGSISGYGQYAKDISLVNGQQDLTRSFGGGGGVKLDYHPLQKLFIDGNASLNYSGAMYSLYASQNTNSLTQNYGLDFSIELSLSLFISSDYNLQVVGSQVGVPARETRLWNAAVSKNFLTNHSLQLRLSAFDLLNSASSYIQTVSQNYIQTQQSNLPGRLFLLSLAYHFSKFPVH